MARRKISQKVAVSAVFVGAAFMAIMDITIVNVAVPTLGRDFHSNPAAVDSIIIGFLVSVAVFIPVSGWLGDRLGEKRVLLASILIFTVASALCGAATSLSELVVFRVLQGVGGGLMTPVGMSMLFRAFPPAERVRVSAILILPTALAPALGPVLGGVFVTDASWRWVFYVNVPIGLAALLFGVLFLADPRSGQADRFDLPGFLLAGAGLGLLMYGVSEGPVGGWRSTGVLTTTILGLVLLIVLVRVELRTDRPMLDLRLYGNRLFRSTSLVQATSALGFLGVLYLVALFFQDGLGLSALDSGLNIFPEAIGVMIGSQVVTRQLYPRFGPRRIMFGGGLGAAILIAVLALVGDGTSLWLIRLDTLVLGLAVSGMFVPTQAAVFATISPADTGRASTLFNAQRQVGGAVGVALLTTIVAAVGPTHVVHGHLVANLLCYRIGFLTAAGVMVLAALGALTVSDLDAAETIVARRRKSAPAAPETQSVS